MLIYYKNINLSWNQFHEKMIIRKNFLEYNQCYIYLPVAPAELPVKKISRLDKSCWEWDSSVITSFTMWRPIKVRPSEFLFEAVPDHESLEQYGTKTWLASAKWGFFLGSALTRPLISGFIWSNHLVQLLGEKSKI